MCTRQNVKGEELPSPSLCQALGAGAVGPPADGRKEVGGAAGGAVWLIGFFATNTFLVWGELEMVQIIGRLLKSPFFIGSGDCVAGSVI